MRFAAPAALFVLSLLGAGTGRAAAGLDEAGVEAQADQELHSRVEGVTATWVRNARPAWWDLPSRAPAAGPRLRSGDPIAADPLTADRGGDEDTRRLSSRRGDADASDPAAQRWRRTVARRLARLEAEQATASEVGAPRERNEAGLAEAIESLVDAVEDDADVGIAITDLDTGEALVRVDAERALNPASNHKLLTAIAAVELLGADYRFHTRVRVDGDALVLVGDGDPSLQLGDVDALARATADAVDLSGITRIVADDSAFSARRVAPGYETDDGPGWSYLAPSGALSLQFNTVEVTVRPSARGQAPRVSVVPPCDHVVVDNAATTAGRGTPWVRTYAKDGQTVVEVRGTIGAGRGPHRERRRIVDPGRFTATTFARALARHAGAPALPVERGRARDTARQVATHASAPLPQVLASALVFSNNFTSEQVLRTLGRRASAQAGDWRNGTDALRRFWSAIGGDPGEITVVNASGFSARGRLTADAIVALLALTTRRGSPAAQLLPILPASGRHGTMRHRLTAAPGRVRAKTGTLGGASALSGVIAGRGDAHDLAFSILVNGDLSTRASRRLQDRVVMTVVRHVDGR